VADTPIVHRPPSGPSEPIEQLRRLQAVTDAALSHLALDQLLSELLARVVEVLGTDTSAILLLDETGTELIARAARGIEEAVERGVRIPVGKGFAGRIAADRRAVIIEDVDHADVLNPILREKGIRSLLGVPLIAHGELLGVLHVGSLTKRVFNSDEVALLQIVGERVALAIERSLIHEQLIRLTQLQRDFVALAAHELRTPATTVYGLAATLDRRADLDPDTVAQLRHTLHTQADRMRRLVEQLLDLSRLDAARIEVSPERVALHNELVQIVETVAPGREADVELDVPDTTHVIVDKNVVERVVGNLLANALQYGLPPVRITARQTDTHLRILVQDGGEGVDPELAPFVFEPFRRGQSAGLDATGSGLGLSIARGYAREHGGDLLYHADGGAGATFELVLPHTAGPPG
jgi:signal transduction histidine kinase